MYRCYSNNCDRHCYNHKMLDEVGKTIESKERNGSEEGPVRVVNGAFRVASDKLSEQCDKIPLYHGGQ